MKKNKRLKKLLAGVDKVVFMKSKTERSCKHNALVAGLFQAHLNGKKKLFFKLLEPCISLFGSAPFGIPAKFDIPTIEQASKYYALCL